MSRDAGFGNADIDVDLLEDAKVRRLIRSTRDEGAVARAIIAYVATVLASWKDGERVTVADALPLWISDPEALTARLAEVGLVDEAGRIVEHAWTGWYGPAAQRRDDRRFEGMVGGLMKSQGLGRSQAEDEARRRIAQPPRRSTSGDPRSDLTRTVPSSPSVPPGPSGHTEPSPTEHAKTTATVSGRRPRLVSGGRNESASPSREETGLPSFLEATR